MSFFFFLFWAAKLFGPKKIVGIDIDEKLVRQAQRNLGLQFSLMSPPGPGGQQGRAMETKDWNHFPISFPLTCGFIPWVREWRPYFPYNVDLRALNFLDMDESSSGKFDVVLL